VLSLRYYACVHCDAVHADVDAPSECGQCGRDGTETFGHVPAGLSDAAAAYFAPTASR
jgi:hypothetical protein